MRLIERDNGAVIIPETEIKILIAATKPGPRVALWLLCPTFFATTSRLVWMDGRIKIRPILLLFTRKTNYPSLEHLNENVQLFKEDSVPRQLSSSRDVSTAVRYLMR